MKVVVNGRENDVPDSQTVLHLMETMLQSVDRGGVAVAINGEVLRRGDWSQRVLHEGDAIEVLGATQGG